MLDRVAETPFVSKSDYAAREPQLRVDLINAQFDLRSADFSVVIVIAGDDRIGVVQITQLLHEWMDARHIDTHIFEEPTRDELERPRFWRYWSALPPHGKIGLYVGAWPLNAVGDLVAGRVDDQEFAQRLGHIRRFEEALAANGTLLLKFWVHTPRAEMKERLKRARKDPRTNWQIEDLDHAFYEAFAKAEPYVKILLDATHTATAPWHVLDGRDARTRDLGLGIALKDALVRRLAEPEHAAPAGGSPPPAIPDALGAVDLTQSLDDEAYEIALEASQARLARLSRRARQSGQGTVLVFEGWDAAGKGGAIRRVTRALAVRDYKVVPIGAPTEEERARHYLWRFWRHLPRAGHMVIFDRSWYGRVLVERVEGLAAPQAWQRAYDEILDFEAQLVERGYVVQKFWLHIDQAEQLARFEARELTPYKKYKITHEDYRNRGRWSDYVAAVNEMVARTSTPGAPWHLVPANDKRYARVEILDALCDALKAKLGKE